MKKPYKKYKLSDCIVVSGLQMDKEQASELGKFTKKLVIWIPVQVDDIPKAFATLSKKQIKQILNSLK